jgi:hypothetical protein
MTISLGLVGKHAGYDVAVELLRAAGGTDEQAAWVLDTPARTAREEAEQKARIERGKVLLAWGQKLAARLAARTGQRAGAHYDGDVDSIRVGGRVGERCYISARVSDAGINVRLSVRGEADTEHTREGATTLGEAEAFLVEVMGAQ